MAAYPTFGQSRDSAETSLDDLQIDRASNGVPRGRAMYTAIKKTFSVVHPRLSASDKTTLDAFYATNRLLQFTFVWAADGATYTCIFASPPPTYKSLPGGRWAATVQMVQA